MIQPQKILNIFKLTKKHYLREIFFEYLTNNILKFKIKNQWNNMSLDAQLFLEI